MMYSFMDNTQDWLEHYHMRSISECVNSVLKRKMPAKIRKKLPQRKRIEEFLEVNMHNLGKYNYLRHTKGEMIGDYYKKKIRKIILSQSPLIVNQKI